MDTLLLKKDERAFLSLLKRYGQGDIPLTRSALAKLAGARFVGRAEERARQSCKRLGLAEFVGGVLDDGAPRRPMGWRLTAKGRAFLAEQGEASP